MKHPSYYMRGYKYDRKMLQTYYDSRKMFKLGRDPQIDKRIKTIAEMLDLSPEDVKNVLNMNFAIFEYESYLDFIEFKYHYMDNHGKDPYDPDEGVDEGLDDDDDDDDDDDEEKPLKGWAKSRDLVQKAKEHDGV